MNNVISPARTALKWGVILGIALIVYSLALYLTDSVGNSSLGFISFALSIAGLVLAMRDYRTLNGGYMSYGEGLSVGTLTSAVSGLLSSVFSVFYTTVIDTGAMARMVERTREQLEDSGTSDDVIEQQLSIIEMFQSPGLSFAFGVIGSVIFGLLLSLVVSAIMRRNRANPFE